MLTTEQVAAARTLVELAPDQPVDIALYWQQWKLDSPSLRRVADAVQTAAAAELTM